MVQSKQKRFTFESLSKSFTKFRIEFGFSFCTNSCIPTPKISGARTLNENWWFVCGQNMFSNQHIKSFFYKSQGSYNIYTQKPVINVNRFLLFVFVCHQTLDKADIQPHGAYYTTWCISIYSMTTFTGIFCVHIWVSVGLSIKLRYCRCLVIYDSCQCRFLLLFLEEKKSRSNIVEIQNCVKAMNPMELWKELRRNFSGKLQCRT